MKRSDFLRTCCTGAAGVALLPGLTGIASASPSATSSAPPWPAIDPSDERFWSLLRDQFPLTHERAYLNTGGLGASPYVVLEAVKTKMNELETICETGHDDAILKEIKVSAAALLGCDVGELAFVRNTTEGINCIAQGVTWKKGDEVILSTHEHVGNSMTWMALARSHGIVIRLFEPSTASATENLDRIMKITGPRTRMISIPHVVTTTGLHLPVKEICAFARSRGILNFIDGAQTAGMMPFSLHEIGCDAYATSGHKWLMGPKETGILYVRKEIMDTFTPRFIGAYSDGGYDFLKGTMAFNPTAQRYEYGTVSIPLRVGLGAAFKFIQRIGIDTMWARDRALAGRLAAGLRALPQVRVLSPEDPLLCSAMTTLMHDKLPHMELQKQLTDRNLRTRSVTEGGLAALRISTHIYNTFEEVDRVIEGVRSAKF
jgi:selenocysteine lyase/cysteine desulfurase